MVKRRIIIEIEDDLTDHEALEYVISVVLMGRISGHGKQYCYHSVMKGNVEITARVKRKGSVADSFIVRRTREYKERKDAYKTEQTSREGSD